MTRTILIFTKTALRYFLLIGIQVLSVVVLAEIIIRIFGLAPAIADYPIYHFKLIDNAKMVYSLNPGAKISEGGFVNSHGFKDSEFTFAKEKNLIRIAMLGDSITEGAYVAKGKTFSDFLEKSLNADNTLSPKYEVMNFGVGGYNLTAETELFVTEVTRYKPDIAVFNLFFNDADLLPGQNLLFRNKDIANNIIRLKIFHKYTFPHATVLKRILFSSHFYRFLRFNILPTKNLNHKLDNFLSAQNKIGPKAIKTLSDNFARIKECADNNNIKVIIYIHPSLLFDQGFPNNQIIADTAKNYGFPVVYMHKTYSQEVKTPQDIQVLPDDLCHPNVYGHKLIAASIEKTLRNLKYIH